MASTPEENLALVPEDAEFPFHKGGPWYILSDGTQKQGREAAETAEADLQAQNEPNTTIETPEEDTVAEKPKPGDFTGRQREEMQRAQAKAAAERSDELTMINAQQKVVDEHAVHDPKTGKVLEAPEGVTVPTQPGDEPEPTPDVGPGATLIEDQAPQKDEGPLLVDAGVEIAEAAEVEIRVNDDISPTIGAGNHYHFEQGKKYKVPVNVAQVLEEKGYLWH